MSFKKYKEEVLKDPRSEKLNFEPDDRLHYVYRVSKDREHYYGSRTDVDDKTIGNGYFTSSKLLEEAFKANPEDYKVKIIRRFDNPADKILFESYLHQYFNVKNHDSFINRSNQTPFGFDTTGTKATLETKEKLKEAHRKIREDPIRSEERFKNISKASFKSNADIAMDPARSKARSESHSLAAAQIKNDTIRDKQRSKNIKEAQLKIKSDPEKSKSRSEKLIVSHEKIKMDPKRSKARSKGISEGLKRYHEEIRNNPEKFAQKINKFSEAARKVPVSQFDLDGNFIAKFSSQKEAARQLGYSNSVGISNCCAGKYPTYKGFIWKK